jgi:hypothetical protein
MNDESKKGIDTIEQQLEALQAANKQQIEFRTQIDNLLRQIRMGLLGGATVQSGVTEERWKLDVNERYQKAVATVISLSTAALGSPFVFLKDIHGNSSILHVLTPPAYIGAILLALSIVCAVVYYFFSAKWVKLALGQKANFFWIPIKEGLVENVLDATYFLMMIGFLVGVYFMLQFMATYVPK